MSSLTILYIIIAGIIALFLALFLYKHKNNSHKTLNYVFTFLRFITIFSVLLLLINPKFEHVSYYTEKPNLIVAVDNSTSIKYLNQDKNALNFIETLTNNKDLQDKFNIDFHTFGNTVNNSDSIGFSENETNLDNMFNKLSQVYKNTTAPMLLITDGNQTFGNDYQYTSSKYKQPIYPIILGDTITYTDLSIQQLNVNKYAFLKNKFPVECILLYNGNNAVDSRFDVYSEKNLVYSQPINLSKKNNSTVVNFTLPANNVGVYSYKATIVPLEKEKNTINNSKTFAVEVIDQKTNIAIVSDFDHPDLGAFKKSIESNEQHTASIIKPNEAENKINDFQLFILYQPNNSFKKLIEALNTENKNRLVVIGTKTDLNFLNSVSSFYKHEITNQIEDYFLALNSSYAPFIVDDIEFETFPPLKSNFGEVTFSIPFESLLFKKVRNITTNQPLLGTFESNKHREGLLLGENIWQWRAQSFLNSKSFSEFDGFLGKIIQYLASNKRKDRLNLDYESFYNGTNGVIFNAEFFDKNYEFDARETLVIKVKDTISKEEKTFPFILKNNLYQVDLSSLPPSDYSFTVSATNGKISKSGTFKILEYNVEQQFLNANVTKLEQIATNSSGNSYFIANTNSVITDLLKDNRYQFIQKESKNTIPLVDFKYLLFLIAFSLAIEWFLRKYNGLI
ncbi:VWA domain-containing protein [Gaetbulibacter sp. M235]|uniref:VWA domain-containing protein n=1 Tax=Gaetbulibacter sp. M235 TaxID=3126510 RepID=UPI00374FC21D